LAFRHLLFWLGALFVCVIALLQATRPSEPAPARVVLAEGDGGKVRLVKSAGGEIPMPPNTPAAHASTLAPLPANHSSLIAAAWFAGERESAPDVRIAFSSFDKAEQRWTPARFIADRESLGKTLGFGIRRLGNPVLWRDDDERLHLFVVGTGIGGWATSRIIHLQQSDDGTDAENPRFEARAVLPLSWLWNLSYLVRNAPLVLADGAVVLPIYFELGTKYPALARLDRAGNFRGISRISRKGNLLQPALLPVSEHRWLAYMRMSGGTHRIAIAETKNAGMNWQDRPDLELPNPNASVAALNANGVHALTFNPSSKGRDRLVTATSADGERWNISAELALGQTGDEYSYPAMLWHQDALWVSYTDRRRHIAWQRFTIVRQSP
jgi:predicted neuraminidase